MTRITFQLAHDLAANWTSNNPVLAMGEKGYETDTKKWKTGDGTTSWSSLAYDSTGTGTVTTVSVSTANGFQGTVATPTTTPAITIQTSLASGIIKSDGSNAFALAVAGTDYQSPYAILSALGGLANAAGHLYNNGSGTLSWVAEYVLPTATSSILGGVKPDGSSILNTAGVISATAASVGALASGGTAANTSQLLGATWAAPAAIGTGTPNAATFTTVTGTSFNSITALASVVSPMDGTAAVGTSTTVARQDHVHASDTSRIATSALSNSTPNMDGVGASGGSSSVSRQDHVHPTDTSRQAAYTNLTGIGSLANAAGYLSNNGSGVFSYASALANPMTTLGDIIVAGAAGVPARLGIGTNLYVLTSNGTTASWQPSAGGSPTPGSINYTYTGASTSQTLQKWMDSAWLTPEAEGAVGDGTTDDHVAIANAITIAAAAGMHLRFCPGKTYYCGTGNLVFTCNVDGAESVLLFAQDYTGIAVQVGVSSSESSRMVVSLPYVKCTRSSYTSWGATPNSVGIRIYNVEKSHLWVAGVEAFAKGLQLVSLGSAPLYTGYNDIELGFMYNNKIQIAFEPLDALSWVNQNNFYHGECHHDSNFGSNVPFCRSVLIRQFGNDTAVTTGAVSITVTASTFLLTWASGNFTTAGFYVGAWVVLGGSSLNTAVYQVVSVGTTTMALASNSTLANETATMTITTRGATFGNIPNNNNFWGTCFESLIADALLEIQGGSQNNFYGCRFEALSQPTIYMCGMGGAAPTQYNSIFGGYTNSSSDFIVLANANTTSNRYETSARLVMSGIDSYGPLQLANVGGISNAVMTIWGVNNTSETTWAHPTGTGWMAQIGAYNWDMKPAAGTVPSIRLSSSINGIYLGNGSTALNAYLYGLASNLGIGVQGTFSVSGTSTFTGAATFSSTVNNVTITPPTTSATLTLVTGSTLQTTGAFTLNLTTTAATTPTFPTGTGTLVYIGGTNTWSAAQTWSVSSTFTQAATFTAYAGGTTNGMIWQDSTQKALGTYQQGLKQMAVGCMFTMTATGTNGAATALTNILGTGVGTVTIPASFSLIGKTIRVRVAGTVTTAASPGTTVITLYLSAGTPVTVVAAPSMTLLASMTNQPFVMEFDLTFRTTTTVMGSGKILFPNSTTGIASIDIPVGTTTAATTVAATAYAIQVAATNSIASGTVYVSQTCTMEVVN